MSYSAVTNPNQGVFNNPRQKTWGIFSVTTNGWVLNFTSNDFSAIRENFRQLLNNGGQYTNINNLIVVEIVPVDTVITP